MDGTVDTEAGCSWFVRSPVVCPFVQDSEHSVYDVLKHNQLFCDHCMKTRIHQLTGGEDIIFHGDFPWKKREEEGKPIKEEEEKLKPGRKRPRLTKKSTDVAHLPDGLIIKSYVNQGLTKDEALHKLVQEKREKAKAMKKVDQDAQKVKTEFNKMPYVPPVPFPNKVSVYPDVADHQRYVAIVSNFLNPIPKFRFESNKAELKSMDLMLTDERKEFQSLVRKKLSTKKGNPFNFEDFDATRFVLARINRRRTRLHGKYTYWKNVELSGPINDGKQFCMSIKNVLHSGRLRKVNSLNEKRRFNFSTNAKEISERFLVDDIDKCPLMDDDTALSLALENDVELIAGASSVMSLMCRSSFIDPSEQLIPIEVRRVYSKHKGEAVTIRIVGKPVVDSLLNPVAVWYKYVKYAVRHSLYPEEKQSRKTGGRQRTVQQKKQNLHPINVNDALKGICSNDEEKELVIDSSETGDDVENGEDLPDFKKQSSGCSNETSGSIKQSDGGCEDLPNTNISDDVVGDIMKQMGISSDSLATTHTIETSEMDEKHHTDSGDIRKRYCIFSFDEGSDNIGDILVRSNNDGLLSDGTPVVISNKIEYASDYGAERLTNDWLLREILKCKLKGVHDLIRYRIHHSHLFLLQKERAIENKLIEKMNNGKMLLMEAYRRLKAVVLEIKSLQEGHYILRCDGNNIKLYSTSKEGENADIDFDTSWNAGVTKNLPPVDQLFNGIDEHVIHVYHTVRRQIPAAFSHSSAGRGKGRNKKNDLKPAKDLSQKSRNARRKYARKLGRQKGMQQQKDRIGEATTNETGC